MYSIKSSDIFSKDASQLLGELNEALFKITGSSGADSFCMTSGTEVRSVFLIGYLDGEPIACGALREASAQIAEIKRVYARKNSIGAAHKIVLALEKQAQRNGFNTVILETRAVNTKAVSFYLSCNYILCPNYGKYIGRADAVCFTKNLK